MTRDLTILGAGLAGCEAAWQAVRAGAERVRLVEMKPQKMTPAHHTAEFAELVCSNSLRSDSLSNAVGLLKEELRRCGICGGHCSRADPPSAGHSAPEECSGQHRPSFEK